MIDKYGRESCTCGYVPPTHTHADDCPFYQQLVRETLPVKSDNLRDRVAKTLYRRYAPQLGMADNPWDDEHSLAQEMWREDADAVIAELDWEWGIQYHAVPSGVVLGGDENPDGSVTQTVWLSSERHARQVLDSPVPVSAIKGTKRQVRRAVGPIEDQPDITGEGWGIHRRTVGDWTFIPGPDYPAEGVADD